MANVPRFRKRVSAIRRAPDGSAFQKCESCGILVAVALADMHYCDTKIEVKRFKGTNGTRRSLPQKDNQHFKNQPISPYRLFMENFMIGHEMENHIEIDRMGFEQWKNMSKEEKQPYVSHARELDCKHHEALNQEANEIIKVDDDGADSAMVGKVDKSQLIYIESSEESDKEDSDVDIHFLGLTSLLTLKFGYWNHGQ